MDMIFMKKNKLKKKIYIKYYFIINIFNKINYIKNTIYILNP